MKERDLKLNNFLTQCKDILPEYLKKLNKKTTSRQNIISIKKIIIIFLKAYYIRNQGKYNRNQINLRYIERYLSQINLEKPINLEGDTTAPKVLINFFTYLSLNQILKKKQLNEIKVQFFKEENLRKQGITKRVAQNDFDLKVDDDIEDMEDKIAYAPELLIREIEPLKEYVPYSKTYDDSLFNFPEGIQFDIDEYWIQIKTYLNQSEDNLINFYFANHEDPSNSFSSLKEQNLISSAFELYDNDQYKEAMKILDKLLKKYPNNSSILCFKGDLLKVQHFHYNALQYYIKSLQTNPFVFNSYKILAVQFQFGGYFYQSQKILSYLLKIKPLDYELNFFMAYNSYQLLKPFKNYLRLAFIINPHFSKKLLDSEWISERFEPKDSLKDNNLSEEEFDQLSKSTYEKASKYFHLFDKTADYLNPLFYFPQKRQHIKKNWYRFEVITPFIENIFNLYHKSIKHLDEFILTKEFGRICLKISKITTNLKVPQKKPGPYSDLIPNKDSWRENFTSLDNEPYFTLITKHISKENFIIVLNYTICSVLRQCRFCSYSCLYNGSDQIDNFSDFPVPKQNIHFDQDGFPEKYNQDKMISRLLGKEKKFLEKSVLEFENYCLKEKLTLKQASIKKTHIEIFLTVLVFLYKIDNNAKLKKHLNIEYLLKFLGFWIIKTIIVETAESMKEIMKDLKLFLNYLQNQLHMFLNNKHNQLHDALNSEDFFIESLYHFQEISNNISKRKSRYRKWSRYYLLWYDGHNSKSKQNEQINKRQKIRITKKEVSRYKTF